MTLGVEGGVCVTVEVEETAEDGEIVTIEDTVNADDAVTVLVPV